ncbi:MAG: PIN domain-containing protein [Armatimonadota bacterium]|nr:PIN domain-containing protein [Armatimonadota bacterium]
MIFVDTSAWFASSVTRDTNYAIASQWLRENTEPLITTDYVVAETLTLLKARGQAPVALSLGQQFFAGTLGRIYYLTKADLLLAWQTFRQFDDKEWSFADCTSKVVIEKLQLTQALTFDHHFHQFGSVAIVP